MRPVHRAASVACRALLVAGVVATAGVAVTTGTAVAATSVVSAFYDCPYGPGSGSGWDDLGRTYLACADQILVYSEDGQLLQSIAVPVQADDVAPSPDGGYLYVATGTAAVRRLDRRSDGSYALDASWRLSSYPLYGTSYSPTGRYVATDAAGDIFVADGAWGGNLTHTVVKYTPDGKFVTRFGEWQKTWAIGFFYWQLNGITVSRDGSHVYTVEGGNDRIQRWDLQADGSYEVGSVFGSTEGNHGDRQGDNCNFNGWTGEFASSYDVGFDGAGFMYVLNTTCTEVDRFDPQNNFVESFDLRNSDSSLPHGFAVSRSGDVFVPQARRVIHTSGSTTVYPAPGAGSGGTPASLRPDGLVKRATSTDKYVGNNIYNTTGTNQTRSWSATRGHDRSFLVSFQNDGNVKDVYRLKSCASSTGFVVNYYRGTTRITSGVTGGTYKTGSLSPRGAWTIRLTIHVTSTAKIGAVKACLVRATSTTRTTKVDAAGARLMVVKA